MHVQAALGAVEDEILQFAIEIGLHLQELQSEHLGVRDQRIGSAVPDPDRLIDEVIGLGCLLGNSVDGAFEDVSLTRRHFRSLVPPYDPHPRAERTQHPDSRRVCSAPNKGGNVKTLTRRIAVVAATVATVGSGFIGATTSANAVRCTRGYKPCIPARPSDVDCYGGSGDGPRYTKPGVVYRVWGRDRYGLDGDNDGRGCE